MYYCGWDGGGTKTDVCILNEKGHPQAGSVFGPLNGNSAGTETVLRTIREALAFMQAQPGGLQGCLGLTIGMAGISNRTLAGQMRGWLRENGYPGPLFLAGDHEIALAGAIEGPGAILIAGTGSICYGKDREGQPFRTGGFGYLIDDAGSGYAIGREILSTVVRASDGRCPATRLTSLVLDALHLAGIPDLITWLYAGPADRMNIAALAPLLLSASGDPQAARIIRQAALDLSHLAVTALTRHDLPFGPLAMTGSILTHFPEIRSETEQQIRLALPDVVLSAPKHTPAEGAARMAAGLQRRRIL